MKGKKMKKIIKAIVIGTISIHATNVFALSNRDDSKLRVQNECINNLSNKPFSGDVDKVMQTSFVTLFLNYCSNSSCDAKDEIFSQLRSMKTNYTEDQLNSYNIYDVLVLTAASNVLSAGSVAIWSYSPVPPFGENHAVLASGSLLVGFSSMVGAGLAKDKFIASEQNKAQIVREEFKARIKISISEFADLFALNSFQKSALEERIWDALVTSGNLNDVNLIDEAAKLQIISSQDAQAIKTLSSQKDVFNNETDFHNMTLKSKIETLKNAKKLLNKILTESNSPEYRKSQVSINLEKIDTILNRYQNHLDNDPSCIVNL